MESNYNKYSTSTDDNKYTVDANGYFIPEEGSDISFYKTHFCNNMLKYGSCIFKHECRFAHHQDQIRKITDPVHISVLQRYKNKNKDDSYGSKNTYFQNQYHKFNKRNDYNDDAVSVRYSNYDKMSGYPKFYKRYSNYEHNEKSIDAKPAFLNQSDNSLNRSKSPDDFIIEEIVEKSPASSNSTLGNPAKNISSSSTSIEQSKIIKDLECKVKSFIEANYKLELEKVEANNRRINAENKMKDFKSQVQSLNDRNRNLVYEKEDLTETISDQKQDIIDLTDKVANLKQLNYQWINTRFEKSTDDNDTLEYVVVKLEEMCKSQYTYEDLKEPIFVPDFGVVNKEDLPKIKQKVPIFDDWDKPSDYFDKICSTPTIIDNLISLKHELVSKKNVPRPLAKKDMHIDNLSNQVKKLQLQLDDKEQAY